ncbi:MAG: methyltransferase domain-containing protein [Terrimicrobiaceae bacterium]
MPGPSDPQFWQERYEAGDTRWDKGAPAPPLVFFLRSRRMAGRVLVPGCGAGHDVREIARQGADVTGLDFAPAAIASAQAFPVAGTETYLQANFLDRPPEIAARFDWIFEHTCYCAIDPARRDDYVKACIHALRPGGCLLAIFYLETGDPPDVGPPFSTSRDEILSRFGPFFEVEFSEVPQTAYPGREGREWLWMARLREVFTD